MKFCLFLLSICFSSTLWCQLDVGPNNAFVSNGESVVYHHPNLDQIETLEQPSARPANLKRALGCDAQVFLTENPILPNNYEASQQIVATGNVQSGTVTMRAGDEVLLEKEIGGGFEVQLGATLEVTIGPCTF